MRITIKPLSDREWDLKRFPAHCRKADIDAHLRREGRGFTLMVFNAQIKKADAAYLEDIEINRCPSGPNWNQVIMAMTEYSKP